MLAPIASWCCTGFAAAVSLFIARIVITVRPACRYGFRSPNSSLIVRNGARKKHHANLKTRLLGLEYSEAHFQLYQRYQLVRHAGGGMDQDNREQYENFILKSNVASFLAEFREEGQVRMVSLIDQLDDGLSSVYTFYDPDIVGASFGVFNILWQIGLAKQLGLPYLYLGYWIEECRKMAYKTRYHPIEGLVNGEWQPLKLQTE